MPRKCHNKVKPKGIVLSIHKITISINPDTEKFDDLKRYESTKVDQRNWLHVPSGLSDAESIGKIRSRCLENKPF